MAPTKILIIEDEILVAREIEGCLSASGYDVVGIAADSETALQQAAETNPNLALVDIVIQGNQDGVDVAMQIRDRFQIPIIYLTAYADDKTFERAKSTCPFGYIMKPFNQRSLQTAIEIALSRYQAEETEKSATLLALAPHTWEYLSILSHELRNPISIIKLATKLLEDYGHQMNAAKQQELLQRIHSAADNMNELIEDVLTLGQAEHQVASFMPETTDLVEFCQTLIETFQWSSNHQSLNFYHKSDLRYACVDKKVLWHLLSNLLSNAIKYSSGTGAVSLVLSQTGEEICFEVHDQGIGIPADDLAHLFQPFRRGRNALNLPGTGLGLAIAKRAAELHGGKIAVNSQIGTGTTFVIKLPLR
jgi:signal transduction histidine kinase